MPQLISTTDEIGVREQRDILFLSFRNVTEFKALDDGPWERIPERQAIIHWLEENGFGWEMCFHIAPGMLSVSYKGAIYLDVDPAPGSDRYEALLEFLEDEAGRCRFPGVDFCLMPLSFSEKIYKQRQISTDRGE